MGKLLVAAHEVAENLRMDIQANSDTSVSIWLSRATGLHIKLEEDDNETLRFSFFSRTSSHIYSGERTDLHDLISVVLAAFIQKAGFCSLLSADVFNPATDADNEIYGRYLLPIQMHIDFSSKDFVTLKKKMEDMIVEFSIFEHFFWSRFEGCPCSDCRKRLQYEYEYRWEKVDVHNLEIVQRLLGEGKEINYCERTLPTWFYYRDFKHGITIVDSPGLIEFVELLVPETKLMVKAIGGFLMEQGTFSYYVSFKTKKRIEKYFEHLGDIQPRFIFLENKIIAVGHKYFITLDAQCGINKHKSERDKLHERHQYEYDALFKPSELIWSEDVNGELFENLIKDLLERENNVRWVRKMAHTNEGDGGVDLVAEWNIPNPDYTITPGEGVNNRENYLPINVIVQCKASKDGIGKSKVQDIRDTIESRNYQGYFLAVSSYLKKSLADHLDKMRVEGKVWVDWWGQDEINKRLIRHKDLLTRYASIVRRKLDT